MKWKEFSDRELVQILRACSGKKGERCSNCPAFGHGDYKCRDYAMMEAARRLEWWVK